MPTSFVLTLSGPDRIGIVDRVTGLVLGRGGNVEASRMARLGGEFAVLMLVVLPEARLAGLDEELARLAEEGHAATIRPASSPRVGTPSGWGSYRIEVEGADHEGIIHEVAHSLAEHGINIESVDSETTHAPVSGSPLFTMTARVAVPPGLALGNWRPDLEAVAGRLNLEVRVTEAPGG